MEAIALLVAATLLGGMTFFSFGFARVLFKKLPIEQLRPLLRGTFPYYYLPAIAAVLAAFVATLPAVLLALITASTVYARQTLMYRINAATDRGDKRMLGILHEAPVVIQLVQIGLAGWAVVALA